MLFNNKLFNSIACLLSFTNLQLVIPGRTWILLYLGRTVYKRLWACLALYYNTVIFFTGQVKQLSLILWFLHVTQFSYAESCGDWVSPTHGIMLLHEMIKLYKIPFQENVKVCNTTITTRADILYQ